MFLGETASCVSDPCSYCCVGTDKEQRGSALLEKQAEWVTMLLFNFFFQEKKENALFTRAYLKVLGVYISLIDLQFILS